MIEDLLVVNRVDGEDYEWEGSSQLWVPWKTCVRNMRIGHVDELNLVKDHRDQMVFQGEDAYAFCLEVICGLHSPLLGETEVFGQFKQKLEGHAFPESHWGAQLVRIFQALVKDAKSIRSEYLLGLGSQSYGSIVRRKVKQLEEVNFLGAGLFVQDLLPWLQKLDIPIRVHCRNPLKASALKNKFKNIEIENLTLSQSNYEKGTRPLKGALIVGAPIKGAKISDWLKGRDEHLKLIFDLRGESKRDPLIGFSKVEDLSQLFKEIEGTKDQRKAQVQRAYKQIKILSQQKMESIQVRPFGWEDLCG